MQVVILANGKFPSHPIPTGILNASKDIVCCDGAVRKLSEYGLLPTAIVGDLDSLSINEQIKFRDRIHFNPDNEINDLTKSVKWCIGMGFQSIQILGATGLSEDHTLGNIGLLASYARMGVTVTMVTDHGILIPMLSSGRLESFVGQKVSIFAMDTNTSIVTKNLLYPICGTRVYELWMGTLNSSLDSWFELDFSPGPLVVYRSHREQLD